MEDEIPIFCTGKGIGPLQKVSDFPRSKELTAFWGSGPGGRGNASARALALVLNPEPAALTVSVGPPGNFGRFAGHLPVLGAPSRVADRKLGRADALGPSTGHAASLFICLELGKFCPTFVCVCNWSCLLPSHLSRHGDASSLGKMGEAS